MVIGRRFAWGHLPKTGGNATLALFDLFPELIVSADRRDSPATHTYFRDRADAVAGKQLVLGIRRLPSWILSHALYQSRHGVDPDYVPLPMESPHQMARWSLPDRVLGSFTDRGRFRIDRWLRMEHLKGDFLDFVSQFTDVTEERRTRVNQLDRVLTGSEQRRIGEVGSAFKLEYDTDIEHWFTRSQLETMYENNPLWRAAEQEAYGGLVFDGT